MQFADFIQEQHASVSLGHRAGFRLRDSLYAQRPSPLVDGIMHAPQQRVGNGTLVKADAGGIHFNKGRILCKRRPRECFAASSTNRAAQVLPMPGGP